VSRSALALDGLVIPAAALIALKVGRHDVPDPSRINDLCYRFFDFAEELPKPGFHEGRHFIVDKKQAKSHRTARNDDVNPVDAFNYLINRISHQS
jgi:hypothetical protein